MSEPITPRGFEPRSLKNTLGRRLTPAEPSGEQLPPERELALRLSERYWDTSRPEYREMLDLYAVEENLRRIVAHPTRITRGPA